MPFSLFLFIYFLVTGNILSLFASIIITLVFSIPSWRSIKYAKIAFNDNATANHTLKEAINDKSNNIPKDIIGRSFYNMIDDIFKR